MCTDDRRADEGVALPLINDHRRARRLHMALVTIVIAAAALLRFGALDRYPLPTQQDELSDIYDGYCIATTGADRTGRSAPFLLRAIGPGDYHPALYAYMAAIPQWFTGFSIYAGRLPAAVLGLMSCALVFLFARDLLGRAGAVIALLCVTFSPVHILYSRQGHAGGCLPPFFSILAIYLVYRSRVALVRCGEDRPRSGQDDARVPLLLYGAAGVAVGLSSTAYGASRLTAVLFAVAGFVFVATAIRRHTLRPCVIGLMVFFLAVLFGASTQIYAALSQPEEFFLRASNVVYPLAMGPRWWVERVTGNLFASLDPRQLFVPLGTYRELTVSTMSIVAAPFFYVGILAAAHRVIRRRCAATAWLVCGILICLSPSLVSSPSPSVMRSSGVWSLYPIISALGVMSVVSLASAVIVRLANRLRGSRTKRPGWFIQVPAVLLATVGLSIATGGIVTVVRYLNRPEIHGPTAQYHLVQIAETLRDDRDAYDRVYIDAPGVFGYLYVAAFAGMTPGEYLRSPREGTISRDGWEHVQRFGKYRFVSADQALADWALHQKDERWLLIRSDGESMARTVLSLPRGAHASVRAGHSVLERD